MQFLAPFMLIGVTAALVPLVIHLIGRRKAPIKKFGAMDFLLGMNRRVARRLHLREMVLLAIRVLSCLAIPLAIAKPFVSCSARGPAVARGPQAAVLVIDNSFTAGARKGGDPLLSVEKEDAHKVLSELGPEADVAIVFTAEGEDAPAKLSRDHLKLGDLIDDAPLSTRPADTTLALRRAAAILSTSAQAARTVYLFSPMVAGGFLPGDPAWTAGRGPALHVVSPGDGTLANVAIVSASAEKDTDVGPRGVRISAEIANYGPAAVADRGVTLRIGGHAVARGLVSLAAGEKLTKRFSAALPADLRSAEVTVELDGDDLAIDDRRYLDVELRRDLRVLLVDGDPSPVPHDREIFYLETALRPGDRADSALDVTTTTADELARLHLADYDAIFLCNLKPLDADRVGELADWVKKGGGLFVSLGDHVDPDAYDQAMKPLLAAPLAAPRQLASGPHDPDIGRAEHLDRFDATHPVFLVFSQAAAGLREASFWKIFLLGTGGESARTTLATFTSGAPALVESRLGSGRLLLFTSTIDRDWNDLAIHPGFLPLVQQTARYLARVPTSGPESDQLVGRAREIPLTPDDTRVDVLTPGGRRVSFDEARVKGRSSISFTETGEPGFYHVTVQAAAGARPRDAADFVANVDPRGSDVRRVDQALLPGGGVAPAGENAAGVAPRRRVELWHALAAALLLFLFSEAILTRRG